MHPIQLEETGILAGRLLSREENSWQDPIVELGTIRTTPDSAKPSTNNQYRQDDRALELMP